MSIRIIKAGIHSSLQDCGRRGFQASGVPVSGAMDVDSLRKANILAGNPAGATALEFTLHGATLMAETLMIIAFSGGGAELYINQQVVNSTGPVMVQPYSVLELKPKAEGCRSYLAVSGGLKANKDLESTSTYPAAALGGLNGNCLISGDTLEIENTEGIKNLQHLHWRSAPGGAYVHAGWGSRQYLPAAEKEITIRFIKGQEWQLFKGSAFDSFTGNSYQVTDQSNRMGYRLRGERISFGLKEEMISTAVAPGTIQVTPQGDLLMLMADAQTTGGYPRIGQVALADMPVCAQLRPGANLKFMEISAEKAESLFLAKEKQLRVLEMIFPLSVK